MATLLLVTDEAIVRKSIQMGLEQQGHQVLFAKSFKEVMAGSYDVDCVISEHWLPDGSGIDLISHFFDKFCVHASARLVDCHNLAKVQLSFGYSSICMERF